MPKNNSEEIVIENIDGPVYKEIDHEHREEDENINSVYEENGDILKTMVILNTRAVKDNRNSIEKGYIIMFIAAFILVLVILNVWDSLDKLKQKKN